MIMEKGLPEGVELLIIKTDAGDKRAVSLADYDDMRALAHRLEYYTQHLDRCSPVCQCGLADVTGHLTSPKGFQRTSGVARAE